MTTTRLGTIAAALLASACSAPSGHDAGPDVIDDFVEAAADVPQDAPVPFYDAGPAPTCAVTTLVRHVADRPGGDTPEAPAGIVRTATGFLVGYHHGEAGSAPDAGIVDGGIFVDRIESMHIGDDGTAAAARIVYDGAANGTRLLGPAFLPSGNGAIAVFDTTMGDPRNADYDVQLRASILDADGAPGTPTTLRTRYDMPQIVALTAGNLLSFGYSYGPPLDGGVVAASPVSMFLAADGSNARANDLDLLSLVPSSITGPQLRAGDDGAYYLYREGQRLGFLRFGNDGAIAGRFAYGVMGSTVRRIEAAGVVADGVVVAWGEESGTHTSVKAVVASTDGVLRSSLELEAFDNEGNTVASAIPAYGGVAIIWRRGTGTAARLRVAIVAPDGRVRVPATDLVAAPGIDGRLALWSSGREIAFVGVDGAGASWGYTFGRMCLPAM